MGLTPINPRTHQQQEHEYPVFGASQHQVGHVNGSSTVSSLLASYFIASLAVDPFLIVDLATICQSLTLCRSFHGMEQFSSLSTEVFINYRIISAAGLC